MKILLRDRVLDFLGSRIRQGNEEFVPLQEIVDCLDSSYSRTGVTCGRLHKENMILRRYDTGKAGDPVRYRLSHRVADNRCTKCGRPYVVDGPPSDMCGECLSDQEEYASSMEAARLTVMAHSAIEHAMTKAGMSRMDVAVKMRKDRHLYVEKALNGDFKMTLYILARFGLACGIRWKITPVTEGDSCTAGSWEEVEMALGHVSMANRGRGNGIDPMIEEKE